MVQVIIVQTSEVGSMVAEEAIKEMGLEIGPKGQVYLFNWLDEEGIRSLLDPNQQQLFITGTIHGEVKPAVELVTRLREEYPELTCLSFAFIHLPVPPFHGIIEKTVKGGPKNALKNAIWQFLEG